MHQAPPLPGTGSTTEYAIEDKHRGEDIKAPELYEVLYKSLINENMPPTNWINTEVPLVDIIEPSGVPSATDPVKLEIASSVLLINAVNFLQYLYNSDSRFFNGNSGLGKKFTINDNMTVLNANAEGMHSLWNKYRQKYNLTDMEYYINVSPVILPAYKVIDDYDDIKCRKSYYDGANAKFATKPYDCPKDSSHKNSNHKLILTSPHLSSPANSDHILASDKSSPFRSYYLGNNNMGFQLKVKLSYKQNDQEMSCSAMQIFTHQTKTLTGNLSNRKVNVESLVSGNNKSLLAPSSQSLNTKQQKNFLAPTKSNSQSPPQAPADRKQTSCDTDGPDYKNITAVLDFANF